MKKQITILVDKKLIEFISLVLEDLHYKKAFQAMNDTECDCCFNHILMDDTFYFIGNKSKLCEDCKEEMQSEMEEWAERLK